MTRAIPDLWANPVFGRLSVLERLLFLALIGHADDQGRGIAEPVWIRSSAFAYDEQVSVADVAEALADLSNAGLLILYEADGMQYYQVAGWWEMQRLQWARPSRYPAPGGWEDHIRCRIAGKYVASNWPPQRLAPDGTVQLKASAKGSRRTVQLNGSAERSAERSADIYHHHHDHDNNNDDEEVQLKASAEASTGPDEVDGLDGPLEPALLALFGKVAFDSPYQRKVIMQLKERYGEARLLAAAQWAAAKGMSLGQAAGALPKALARWREPVRPDNPPADGLAQAAPPLPPDQQFAHQAWAKVLDALRPSLTRTTFEDHFARARPRYSATDRLLIVVVPSLAQISRLEPAITMAVRQAGLSDLTIQFEEANGPAGQW